LRHYNSGGINNGTFHSSSIFYSNSYDTCSHNRASSNYNIAYNTLNYNNTFHNAYSNYDIFYYTLYNILYGTSFNASSNNFTFFNASSVNSAFLNRNANNSSFNDGISRNDSFYFYYNHPFHFTATAAASVLNAANPNRASRHHLHSASSIRAKRMRIPMEFLAVMGS
jgi:hypothetical protein